MRKTLIPSIEDRLWEKKAFEKLIRQEKESIKESEKLDLTTQQLYFKNVPVYFNANDIQTLKKRTYTT